MPHSAARQHEQQLIIDLQEQYKAYHDKTAKGLKNLNPYDTVYIMLDLTQNKCTQSRVSEWVKLQESQADLIKLEQKGEKNKYETEDI